MIRSLRVELGTTGVDGLVGRFNTVGLARRSNFGLGDRPQITKLCIGEAELLDPTPLAAGHRRGIHTLDHRAFFGDALHLVEEPRVDLGQVVHLVDGLAPT